MMNSGPPPPFAAGPRERRSRWDPMPKQGIIEKNFYVMHPDISQRQEVRNHFSCKPIMIGFIWNIARCSEISDCSRDISERAWSTLSCHNVFRSELPRYVKMMHLP